MSDFAKALTEGADSESTEIVFSFDTTGSMAPCIADVRSKLKETCEELFDGIKNLRIGLIAHGDYCDRENCLHVLELTNDLNQITDFVMTVPNTSGGDADECYELVLNAASKLNWSNGDNVGRAFMMIGDAEPHGPDYGGNVEHLVWETELRNLMDKGVRCYAAQAFPHGSTPSASFVVEGASQQNVPFWESFSEISGTPLLKLDSFDNTAINISAMAFAAAGSESYATYRSTLRTAGCTGATMANLASLEEEASTYDVLRKSSRTDES